LLEFRALGGIISITHYGNKEVEENLKKHVQITEQILSTDHLTVKTDLSSNQIDNILTQYWSKIESMDIWQYYEIKACFIRYHETDKWKITFLHIELLSIFNNSINVRFYRF